MLGNGLKLRIKRLRIRKRGQFYSNQAKNGLQQGDINQDKELKPRLKPIPPSLTPLSQEKWNVETETETKNMKIPSKGTTNGCTLTFTQIGILDWGDMDFELRELSLINFELGVWI